MTNPSRTKALRHFPHRCDRCGLIPPNLRSLHVHHRDLDRTNNELSNLQVLCRPCHYKVHVELGSGVRRWESRRKKGGKFNVPPISLDGSLAEHSYRDDPETGCRIWLMSHRGSTPEGRSESGEIVNIRRELWRIHRGEPIPENVGASCDNASCVALGHMFDGKTWHGIPKDKQMRIREMAGRLATSEIARRLGVSDSTVTAHGGTSGKHASHRAALKFACRSEPPRPDGITDRQWSIFLSAREQKLCDVGTEFGISRQRVDQIIKHVMSALEMEGIAA